MDSVKPDVNPPSLQAFEGNRKKTYIHVYKITPAMLLSLIIIIIITLIAIHLIHSNDSKLRHSSIYIHHETSYSLD